MSIGQWLPNFLALNTLLKTTLDQEPPGFMNLKKVSLSIKSLFLSFFF